FSGLDSAVLDFETAQGAFQIRTDEIAYGHFVPKLNGRVLADRIPPSTRITDTAQEQEDFPSAAADRDGNVWMAFVSFRHHPRHNEMRAALRTPLQDFAPLQEPPAVTRRSSGSTRADPGDRPYPLPPPGSISPASPSRSTAGSGCGCSGR